jgi:hypothetical protein
MVKDVFTTVAGIHIDQGGACESLVSTTDLTIPARLPYAKQDESCLSNGRLQGMSQCG